MNQRYSTPALVVAALFGALFCQRPDIARLDLAKREYVLYGREPFALPLGDPPRPVVVQAAFASGDEEVLRPLSLTTWNGAVGACGGGCL